MDNYENEHKNDGMKEIELNPCDDAVVNQVERVNENVDKYQYLFSVCLIGDANVGKTSLLTRYCDNVFKEKYSNTIGVDFRIVSLKLNDVKVKLHLWDTAGQERFRSIAVNYFRNVHGFFFVFDLSCKESFEHIINWVELAKTYNKHKMINFLVGNKNDLERKVSEKEVIEFAENNNFIYFETSAKTNQNVEKAFHFMTYKLADFYAKNKQLYDLFSNQGNKLKEDDIKNTPNISINSNKKCSC